MKITKITPAQLRIIDVEIKEAMGKIAKRYGLTYENGRGTYTNTSFSVKGEFSTESGVKENIDTNNSMLQHYGLAVGDKLRTSKPSLILTITGYNTRWPKRSIEAIGSDGQPYKTTVVFATTMKMN